jgi:hypothetical protein
VPQGKVGVIEFVSAACATDSGIRVTGMDISVEMPGAAAGDAIIAGLYVEASTHPLNVTEREENGIRHYVASQPITLRVPYAGPARDNLAIAISFDRLQSSVPSPLQCRLSISGYLTDAAGRRTR